MKKKIIKSLAIDINGKKIIIPENSLISVKLNDESYIGRVISLYSNEINLDISKQYRSDTKLIYLDDNISEIKVLKIMTAEEILNER